MIPNLFDPRRTHNDNVYFNARYVNDSNTATDIISFDSNRNDPVIPNASMYYLIVESFEIPNRALPIFIWDNTPDANGKYPYAITIDNTTDGKKQTIPIPFISRGDFTDPGNTSSQKIYYLSQVVEMVNLALSAGNAVDGGVREVETQDKGRFKLNSDGRFSFKYDDIENKDVDFSLSTSLYELFLGFDGTINSHNSPTYEDFTLAKPPEEGFTLEATDDTLTQEHKSQFMWPEFKKIYLFTNSLPIVQEQFSNRKGDTSDEKFKIIADFFPVYPEDGDIDRSPWIFFNDYPKLIDMRSDVPINSISFTAAALDKKGNLVRIPIPPGDTAYIKIRFVKKAIFNNEYNIAAHEKRTELYNVHTHHRPRTH